jgi:hypothetical protein
MTCIKYLLFIILIIGLTLIIYGSSNIPNEIPGYTAIYSGNSESISAQSQQHQDDLRNYQIRSREFLITMIGLGIFLIGLIFCIYSYYKSEHNDATVAIIPDNLRKQIELKKHENISKTETATAPKIDEVRPLELSEQNINVKPPLESNSPPATLVPSKKIIPESNKQVQFNIPQSHPRPLYYKYYPEHYQEYYNKNGYPRPILYQVVR